MTEEKIREFLELIVPETVTKEVEIDRAMKMVQELKKKR